MAYTHKFKIEAGDFTCKGKVTGGMGYYEYDEDSARPNAEMDTVISQIIDNIGRLSKAYGSIEKVEIKVIEE